MSDPFAEYEVERLAQIDREEAARNTPESVAARDAKRQAEFDKGVRLGWWDAEGNSLIAETDDYDAEDAEDDD